MVHGFLVSKWRCLIVLLPWSIFVTVSRNLQFINEGNGEYLSADYLGAVSRNPRPICLSRKGDFGSTWGRSHDMRCLAEPKVGRAARTHWDCTPGGKISRISVSASLCMSASLPTHRSPGSCRPCLSALIPNSWERNSNCISLGWEGGFQRRVEWLGLC